MTNDPAPTPGGALETLTEAECLQLLQSGTVGRIAYVDAEGQQLIPVNYVAIEQRVYFRTIRGGLLAKLELGHDDVAFGVDHHDDMDRSGWNVTVRGSARRVEDRATISAVVSGGRLEPWAGGTRPIVIEVQAQSMAGRRVHRPNAETA